MSSFLSEVTKPFTAPFNPKQVFTNIKDHYKNNTIIGKLVSGKSFEEALKETASEKTIIGRMTTKDENIFEAVHGTVCATDLASASIFGSKDVNS